MMKDYGQFDVPNNKKVKGEFTCPECGAIIKAEFTIKPVEHSDEDAVCKECGKPYHIVVLHGDGSGTVNVPSLKDQREVKAQGLP